MPEESSEKELAELVTKQSTIIPEKSPEKESGKPEIVKPELIPIKSPDKEIGNNLKIKKNAALDITPKLAKESSKESLNKVPAAPIITQSAPDKTAKQEPVKPAESLPSTGKNYDLQIYMLALLNFLTIVIILLLSINLLKKKSGINSEHPGEISESLRRVDGSIAAIDALINREFKKHDES
jgi:hypothetical protein